MARRLLSMVFIPFIPVPRYPGHSLPQLPRVSACPSTKTVWEMVSSTVTHAVTLLSGSIVSTARTSRTTILPLTPRTSHRLLYATPIWALLCVCGKPNQEMILGEVTVTGELEKPPPSCPLNMRGVQGGFLANPFPVAHFQKIHCKKWLKGSPRRCAEFDSGAWSKLKKLSRTPVSFCIDTYEWPNVAGEKPVVDVSWKEASLQCESVGKRLCTENEWTFACEGEGVLPYPYGFIRDATACNIDKPWIRYSTAKLSFPGTRAYEEETQRLWQGALSGEYEDCISPFGVHDMTGNVDEWTVSTSKRGYRSILKGGYWSVVRTQCRSSTRVHNEEHRMYQTGFRCCKDTRQ
jgi:sulfatase modifying factor 1